MTLDLSALLQFGGLTARADDLRKFGRTMALLTITGHLDGELLAGTGRVR